MADDDTQNTNTPDDEQAADTAVDDAHDMSENRTEVDTLVADMGENSVGASVQTGDHQES